MKKTMKAMILKQQGRKLQYVDIPVPQFNDDEILIKVHVCGICRTDLHVIDGDLKHPKLPLIPGHQIVGTIVSLGKNVRNFHINQRIGVPWLGGSCNYCNYCLMGRQNLCDNAQFTGYQIDGGFAQFCVANSQFCFPIPNEYSDEQAAPLLCAGLIGYRSLNKTGDAKRIGLYGFGAAAHIVIQVARYQGREVYAFTRPDDIFTQNFARELGATWVGGSTTQAPELLDAAIIFAPDGDLVPIALRAVSKGGIVVCAGVHMSDIPSFSYDILWGERILCSIANLTRQDGEEFLALASKISIKTTVNVYPLINADNALDDLRNGKFTGAGVIKV